MLTTFTEHEIITTTARSRYVDYDDIEARVEIDDDHYGTPWDDCDGWEHDFDPQHWSDHEDKENAHNYVRRSARDGGCGFIVIGDDTVRNRWGCDSPYSGASKQVAAEYRAHVNRRAVEQLVNWYENGWTWYLAVAEFGEHFDALHGIDSEEYAAECAEECRENVADELEKAGFIIRNRPAPKPPYSRVDAFRNRIKRQLDCSR